MSYHESTVQCDWCVRDMNNGASVACGECMTEMEIKIRELEDEISRLKEES